MKLATAIPTPFDVLRTISVWLKVHPKTRYAITFAVICTICYFILEGTAWADTESRISARTFYLPLEGVTDTHGVPIWRYLELPTDPGNGPTYIMRSIRHFVASLLWTIYSFAIALGIGMAEWIISFEWLSWIAAPFELVANGVSDLIDAWMLIPLAVLISSIWIAVGFVRGRTGASIIELVMVSLVFGIIASPIANPLTWLTGDGSDTASENGLIQRSAQFGTEAGTFAINPDAEVEDVTLSGAIIDVTLRRPLQSIAFGAPLEGQCETDWNTHAAEDSGLDAEDIRKEVIKCDDAVADANQTDSFLWLGAFLMALPATLGVNFLLAVFLGFLLYEVGQAFIATVAAIIKAGFALLPGNSRTAWLNSLFQVVVSGVLVGVYVFALVIYVWLMGALIENIPPPLMTLGSIIIGIFIIIAAITFWRMKRAGKTVRKTLAEKFGRTGLSKDAQPKQPSKFGSNVRSAAARGLDMYDRRRLFRNSTQVGRNSTPVGRMARTATTAAGVAAAVSTGGASAAATKAGTSMAKRAGTALATRAGAAVASQTGASAVGTHNPGQGGVGAPSAQAALPPGAELPSHEPPALNAAQESTQDEGTRASQNNTEEPRSLPSAGRGQVVIANEPDLPAGHPTPLPTHAPTPGRSSEEAPPKRDTQQSVHHIPEGKYGNNWVHKNGEVHSPMTIRPDGSRVKNIPPEHKINKAFHEGDSWVTSQNIKDLNPSSTQATPAPEAMRPRNMGSVPKQEGNK